MIVCIINPTAFGRRQTGSVIGSIGAAQVVEKIDLNGAKATKPPKARDDAVYKEQLKHAVRLELGDEGVFKICKLDAAFAVYNNVACAQAVLNGVFCDDRFAFSGPWTGRL